MATFLSDLIPKRLRHRGVYDGKIQSVTGSYRLNPGVTLTTADVIQMIELGENVRPVRLVVAVKEVSGTPTVTGTVSVGVAPSLVANLVRPTGETFPPLTAAATLYSASINLGTTATTHVNPAVAPTTNTDWGPFYVTVTPTANLSVADGSVDIFVTAEFEGEHQEVAPIYSEFNASKYKN